MNKVWGRFGRSDGDGSYKTGRMEVTVTTTSSGTSGVGRNCIIVWAGTKLDQVDSIKMETETN